MVKNRVKSLLKRKVCVKRCMSKQRENHAFVSLNALYGKQFSRSLVFPSGQSSCSASHSQLICLRDLSLGARTHLSQDADIKVKASRSKTHQGLKLSSDFDSKEPFCTCKVSLTLKKEKVEIPLIPLLRQGFTSCPCQIIF